MAICPNASNATKNRIHRLSAARHACNAIRCTMSATCLYSDTIDNSACGGCHEEPANALKQGHLAHSLLNCTFCHADEHGAIATCSDCHDTPHSAEMLEGFSGCNDCHGNPHNLLPGS